MNKTVIKAAVCSIVTLLGIAGVYTGIIDVETLHVILEAVD